MAHAQGRGSHGLAMHQQDGALASLTILMAAFFGGHGDLFNEPYLKFWLENMMVGKGHLTGREHDVLSGLFAGSSNKEIARSLNLSEVTIKHHLKSLRSKLGAKNRTHAVCRAIELGIS